MKNLLNDVNALDDHIRQLCKMESKMRVGQFIDAWRDSKRIIAYCERNKQDLIKEAEENAK